MTKRIIIRGVPLNNQARALELLHYYIGNYAANRPNGYYNGVGFTDGGMTFNAYQTKTAYIIAHYSKVKANE